MINWLAVPSPALPHRKITNFCQSINLARLRIATMGPKPGEFQYGPETAQA